VAGNGGARPGAGRPANKELYHADIRKAEHKIKDRLPEIVEAQIALALGVMVEDTNPITHEVAVYQKPPDAKAGQYLMDRLMGKPTERKEVDANVSGVIAMVPWVRAKVADASDS
jgi:hypothetical protein